MTRIILIISALFSAIAYAELPDTLKDPATKEVVEYLDSKTSQAVSLSSDFRNVNSTITVSGLLDIGWERIECNVASGAGPADCSCSTGKKLTGGGVDGLGAGIVKSFPFDNDTWRGSLGAGQTNWKVYAICARIK
jgi:hypothetical protein